MSLMFCTRFGNVSSNLARSRLFSSSMPFGMYCRFIIKQSSSFLVAWCVPIGIKSMSPGPSTVSDSPVSAENVIYEALVLMGEIG